MTFWLKMIGTSEKPWSVSRCYDRKHVGFRGRKPSGIHPGDRLIPSAVGSKRIFALADVTSDWKANDEVGWPYRVDIRWPMEINVAPSTGVDVNEISADLSERLRRRSHIRLTREEFGTATAKLREASDRL
jgi:hypothetical protein